MVIRDDGRGDRRHSQAEFKPSGFSIFPPPSPLPSGTTFAVDIIVVRCSEQFGAPAQPSSTIKKPAEQKSTAAETSAEKSAFADTESTLAAPGVIVTTPQGHEERSEIAVSGNKRQGGPSKHARHQVGQSQNSSEDASQGWKRDPTVIAHMLRNTLRDARVLLWEYSEQSITKKKLTWSANETAKHLENSMRNARMDCSSRPIMFIGDEFGVVVIKEYLMRCAEDDTLRRTVVWVVIGVMTLWISQGQMEKPELYLEIRNKWFEAQSWPKSRQPTQTLLTTTLPNRSTSWDLVRIITETDAQGRLVDHGTLPSRWDFSARSRKFEKLYDWHATWRPAMALNQVTLHGPRDYTKVSNIIQTKLNTYLLLDMAQSGDTAGLEAMLQQSNGVKIDLRDGMRRSALHLGVRGAHPDVVGILGKRGDAGFFSMKDNNGRNALHYAAMYCRNRTKFNQIVEILVDGGIDLGARDEKGLSARQAATDRPGLTQLLQKDESFKISPFSNPGQSDPTSLRPEMPGLLAGQVCRGYRATLAEFYSNTEKGEQVRFQQPSVYDLLYDDDGNLERFFRVNPNGLPEDSQKPTDVLQFRWYHLPVNHVGWVRDLFTRLKVITDPPEHDQHNGEAAWSRFMRPQARNFDFDQYVRNFGTSLNDTGSSWSKRSRSFKDFALFIPFLNFEMEDVFLKLRDTTANELPPQPWADFAEKQELFLRQRSPAPVGSTPETMFHFGGGNTPVSATGSAASPSSISERDFADDDVGSWPEKTKARPSIEPDHNPQDSLELEEKLLYGYPLKESCDVHPRRTLDQAHYPMLINTRKRDEDQVVLRRQKGLWSGQEIEQLSIVDTPRLVMVDQLWIWIVGNDTVVTSFPQKWRAECDVLEYLLLYLKREQRAIIPTVHDFAELIIKFCVSIFNNADPRAELPLHNLFEKTVGDIADRQTNLFRQFKLEIQHLSKSSKEWKESSEKGDKPYAKNESQEKDKPRSMDKMFGIEEDIMLVDEIRDLRDELKMILRVLHDQELAVREMLNIIIQDETTSEQPNPSIRPKTGAGPSRSASLQTQKGNKPHDNMAWRRQRRIDELFRKRHGVIEANIRDFTRMLTHVDTSYEEANSLLDLKQKQLNVLEARSARHGANTILVFTVATILFGGLSFVTAFFTLNVTAFPHQQDETVWRLGNIVGYVVAVSLALTLPFIVFALLVSNISRKVIAFFKLIPKGWTRLRRWVSFKLFQSEDDTDDDDDGDDDEGNLKLVRSKLL